MKTLIFRTDIKTKRKIKEIKPVFKNNSNIVKWSIDTEDIDNVLKIEVKETLNEHDVIDLIKAEGFYCDAL